MIEERSQVVETPTTDRGPVAASATGMATDRRMTTAYDPYQGRRAVSARLVQAVYLIFGLLEGLLLIRFLLKALGASAEAGFAQAIYGVTGPLVAPFVGLFATPEIGVAALELHTLIALVIYAVVGWVLVRVTWLLFGEQRSASVSRSESVETAVR